MRALCLCHTEAMLRGIYKKSGFRMNFLIRV